MLEFHLVRTGGGESVACSRCAARTLLVCDDAATVRERLRVALAPDADGVVADVIFAGGEPLSRDDIRDLVESARQQGVRRIAALTDAAAVADPVFGAVLLRSGLQHLHVPLLGPDEPSHDSLAAPGDFARTTAGMRAFRAAAAELGIRTMIYGRIHICPHNAEWLPTTVKTFAEHGADAVMLEVDDSCDLRRTLPWIVAAFDTGLMNGVWVSVEGIAPELLGAASAALRAPVRFVEELS